MVAICILISIVVLGLRGIPDDGVTISLHTALSGIEAVICGIAWLSVAVVIFFRSDVLEVVRLLLIAVAIVSNAFQITAVLPKYKIDEMSTRNLRKAESKALSGMKVFVAVALIILLIAVIVCKSNGIKEINISWAFLPVIAALLSMLGISNILVGFFRQNEKE